MCFPGSVDHVKAELVEPTNPALFPENCMKGDIPQKVLDSPASSTNATRDAQNRPIAKPRQKKPGALKQTKSQAGNADHASCDTDTATSKGYTDDDDYEGAYAEVDMPKHDDTAPKTIAPRHKKTLFYEMHKIREFSQMFLESMVHNLDSELFCDVICDVVCQFASQAIHAYVKYICNMQCQKDTLILLRKESARFVEIVNKLEMDSHCNRLSFDSFLSLPFQRILQLKVLMEVLEKCDRELGKMEQFKELVNITNKIEFKYKSLPLVSTLRWLIRDGEVTQLALNENIFGQKKNCPLRLILFNDLLLLAANKGSDRYVVHDHVHRSLTEVKEGAEVKDDLEGYDVSKVFQLTIMKCHRGQSKQLLLQASTIEERDDWIKVLRVEEGVYGELDCPQVLCTEAYNGQKPGELSIQPKDKINVFQKTPD
ncbi:ephexin-1-like, partial [Clarias magur]